MRKELEVGLDLHKSGDFAKAEAAYRKVLRYEPDHAEALHFLGLLSYQNGKNLEAIRYIEKAISLNPTSAIMANNLGLAFQAIGNVDAACSSYRQAIESNSRLPSAYNNLANALREIGNFKEAIANYRVAIQLSPNYAKAYNNLGVTLQAIGKEHKAIENFRNAISIDVCYAEPYFNLGSVLLGQDSFEEAVLNFSEAIKINPNYIQAHVNLGVAFQKLSRFDDAMSSFEFANTKTSKAKILECLFSKREYDEFYKRLADFTDVDSTNISLAAISAFASSQLKKTDPYPFCPDPLDFLKIISLENRVPDIDCFMNEVIKESMARHMVWEPTGISTRSGFQTKDDLFVNPGSAIEKLGQIIVSEIKTYFSERINFDNLFVGSWPRGLEIKGWFVRLLKSGFQSSHIHPDGWLSGVVYLAVPNSVIEGEGAIEFDTNGSFEPAFDGCYNRLRHVPKKGELILFPSSLFHKTIPITVDQERLSIAFDLVPN